jgi:phosphopantothenoylcysteine synthetase/decarboxylase
METPLHILNQMGILTAFSVAKKVTEEEVHDFFEKHKESGKTDEEIGEMMRNEVLKEIQDALASNKIPGLIVNQDMIKKLGSQETLKNISELNRLIMIVGNKILEKQYEKMSLCYFINSLVNMLGLTEKDFEKFHRRNVDEEDIDEEDIDEEDIDEDGDDADEEDEE